jgi:hypothetical protein
MKQTGRRGSSVSARKARLQRADSGFHDDRTVDTPQTNYALPEPTLTRQDRQRVEVLASVDAGRLHRAADLAHEHLAEFPSDRSVLLAVVTALERCTDERVRRRVGEFARNEVPKPGFVSPIPAILADVGDTNRGVGDGVG